MKDFLKNLQESPESVKRRWIFGLSLAATALIVFVWLNFMNGITPLAPTGGEVAVPVAVASGGGSFFDTMRAGMSSIGNLARDVFASLGQMVKSLGSLLKAPKNYLIKP